MSFAPRNLGLAHPRAQPLNAKAASAYSDLQNFSDETLIESLRDGHQDALAVLFDRYYRMVLSIALRTLRDPAEAEDLMQDVFFEIHRSVKHFDPAKGTVKTWIRLYAVHRSLNRWKHLNVRKHYEVAEISTIDLQLSLHNSSGWGNLNLQECLRLVEQGLNRLKPRQRLALELAFFRGYVLSEIAEHMRESLPNVRHHYYRGLQKLRVILGEGLPTAVGMAAKKEVLHGKS